jgi:putative ABC transport system permease protein
LVDTGGLEQVKQQVRDSRSRWLVDRALERLRFDAATATRSLRATPAVTSAVVLTVAVAAGVNLTMFGLIDRALLSPPAHVDHPERVFTLALHAPGDGTGLRTTMSYPTFRQIRDEVTALEAAAFERETTSAVIAGEQRRVTAMIVSGTYFDVLGVRPILGPGFLQRRDDVIEPAVVLSHAFWTAAFGGDPAIVGQHLTVRGVDCSVAGVMPAGFSGHTTSDVDLWLPFSAAMSAMPGWDRDPYRNFLSILVRTEPGVTEAAAGAQASRASGLTATLDSIVGTDVAPTEQQVAWWLAGVSVLILIVGLANAGTLLVVRSAKRRQDVAIRTALGASSGRLVAQAALEGALIAIAATVLSLIFAAWLDEPVRRVLFPDLIGRSDLARRTMTAAVLSGLLAAVVAASVSVWQVRAQVRSSGVAATRSTGRTRSLTALLVVQTGLSMLLLAGAGLFGRSLYKLAEQDLGLDMHGVVVVDFDRALNPVPDQDQLFTTALDQVRRLPGVAIASVIDSVPFSGFNVPPISIPGHPDPPSVGRQLPYLIASTPESLQILGIGLVEGRLLTAADDRGAMVVLVNRTMAREVWPGESALGKCIRIGFDPDFDPATAAGPPVPSAAVTCREVVGVVRDVRQRSLVATGDEAHVMQYFVPFSQVPRPPFIATGPHIRGLLLRTTTDADALAGPIRRWFVGQRHDLPFVRVTSYASLLDRQMRPWRLGTTLLALFSAIALAVAAIGMYAVFAHAVSERRREMAIRLAIGAHPEGVFRLVLREAGRVAGLGILCGTGVALLAGKWIQALLFETTTADPLVLGAAGAIMLAVALVATLLPARAASKADPNELLRVV